MKAECKIIMIADSVSSSTISTQVTPLHLAAELSPASVVITLIQAGADVDALDSDQQSPLHLASWRNPAIVPVLIGAGCKVNVLNNFKLSPLTYAAEVSEDRSAVAALIAAAADPHLGESDVSDNMKDYIRSLAK